MDFFLSLFSFKKTCLFISVISTNFLHLASFFLCTCFIGCFIMSFYLSHIKVWTSCCPVLPPQQTGSRMFCRSQSKIFYRGEESLRSLFDRLRRHVALAFSSRKICWEYELRRFLLFPRGKNDRANDYVWRVHCINIQTRCKEKQTGRNVKGQHELMWSGTSRDAASRLRGLGWNL